MQHPPLHRRLPLIALIATMLCAVLALVRNEESAATNWHAHLPMSKGTHHERAMPTAAATIDTATTRRNSAVEDATEQPRWTIDILIST
ncbi:MAG: hypothetical protein QM808_12420 [Steroidobacteraceae bacterium]